MIRHTHARRVYFADTDAGGVVYHAAYLAIAEEARTEALRDAGLPHAVLMAEHGRLFVVRRLSIEYLRAAKLDDLLSVTTESGAVTAATVELRQFVTLDGRPAATIDLTLACIDRMNGGARRIPETWRDKLKGEAPPRLVAFARTDGASAPSPLGSAAAPQTPAFV